VKWQAELRESDLPKFRMTPHFRLLMHTDEADMPNPITGPNAGGPHQNPFPPPLPPA
jgi:hypothetical protein